MKNKKTTKLKMIQVVFITIWIAVPTFAVAMEYIKI